MCDRKCKLEKLREVEQHYYWIDLAWLIVTLLNHQNFMQFNIRTINRDFRRFVNARFFSANRVTVLKMLVAFMFLVVVNHHLKNLDNGDQMVLIYDDIKDDTEEN